MSDDNDDDGNIFPKQVICYGKRLSLFLTKNIASHTVRDIAMTLPFCTRGQTNRASAVLDFHCPTAVN